MPNDRTTEQEVARLAEQNRELAAALRALVSLHHDWTPGSAYIPVGFAADNRAAISRARDALAKAQQ
jgi:hypothetical protein